MSVRNSGALGMLAATTCSTAGNAVVMVAVPFIVLQRTGSATLAGTVGAAALAPLALSTFFGGVLIDRIGRRTCAVLADVCSALAFAALPLLDAAWGLSIPVVLVLVALGAVFDGPGAAARETLRSLVAARSGRPLAQVNAWGEAAESIGGLVGPGLAGILLAVVGGFGVLWPTVVLFLLAALLTAATTPSDDGVPRAAEPLLVAVRSGITTIVRDPALRLITLVAVVVVTVVAPFESVVLASHFQALGQPALYGAVITSFAAGGLAGAVLYGFVGHRLPVRGLLAGILAAAGLGIAAFALLPPVPVMIGLGLAVGFASGPVNPIAAAVMQQRTPPERMGRVVGSYTGVAAAAGPAGLLLIGPLVQAGGPAVGFLVIGAGLLAAAVVAGTARGLRGLAPAYAAESEPAPTGSRTEVRR